MKKQRHFRLASSIQVKKRISNMTNSEKPPSFISSNSAAVLSVTLCLPLLFLYVSAAYDPVSEPSFAHLLTVDGFRPSLLGYIVMLGMLLSLPVAFVINLLPMFTKASSEQPTPAHTIIGMSILVLVLITMRQGILYELRPFVNPLGLVSILGQILFFLLLLVLPAAFLLNRLPRIAKAGTVKFQPTSINLIIGAAIFQVILMLLSAFMLEATACSIGVPNCD